MDAMSNSAGELKSSYDIFLDSVTGHINQFKAAFQGLSGSLFESDFLVSFIDLGTTLVGIGDKLFDLINMFGGLKSVLVAVGAAIIAVNYTGTIVFLGSMIERVAKLKDGLFTFGKAVMGLPKSFVALNSSIKNFVMSSENAETRINGLIAGLQDARAAITTIVSAIAIGIIAYNAFKRAQEQARQSLIASGESASDEADNITSLYAKYKDAIDATDNSTESKERLTSAATALCEALGMEQSQIDEVTKSAKNMNAELDDATVSALNQQVAEMLNGFTAAGEQLQDDIFQKGFKLDVPNLDEWERVKEAFSKAGLSLYSDVGAFGGQVEYWIGEVNSAEDAVKVYQDLLTVQQVLMDLYGSEAKDTSMFKGVGKQLTALEESYGKYIELEESLNTTYALMSTLEYQNSDEYIQPTDAEAFDELRTKIIETAEANNWFVVSSEKVGEVLDSVLKTLPEYAQFYDEVTSTAADATKKLDTVIRAFARSVKGGNGSYADFYDWYKSLNDSDKELVYQISLKTDTTDWDPEKWKEELYKAQFHFEDLMKPKDTTSSEAPTFNEQVNTINDEIEKLNKARAELAENKKEYDAVALTFEFPELGGVSKDNLDDAIVEAIGTRIQKLIDLVNEQRGNLSTEEDKNKLDAFLQDLIVDVLNSNELATQAEDNLKTLYDTLGNLMDGSITNEEIFDFNKLYPEFKIDKSDISGSIENIYKAINAQFDSVASEYDARIASVVSEYRDRIAAEVSGENRFDVIASLAQSRNQIVASLMQGKDEATAEIRAAGIDYANTIGDALLENVSTVNDMIKKVQEGSVTPQDIIEFKKLFPEVTINMNDVDGTLESLRNANRKILSDLQLTYREALAQAETKADRETVLNEYREKLKEYYASIAVSYTELAQIYIDGIDKVNDAISKVDEGSLSASDVIEIKAIFPNIDLNMNDATASVNALVAARKEAYSQIKQFYDDARSQTTDKDLIASLNAQEVNDTAKIDAKTMDAEIERIRSYADKASKIRDIMKSVADRSASQQDIAEFNQMFPNLKIDMNDVKGSMQNLDDAIEMMLAEEDRVYEASLMSTQDVDLIPILAKAHNETVAQIHAGGIDYANSMADVFIENIGTVHDMIENVQNRSVTQQEIVDFNKMFPEIEIDMNDVDGTIENLRSANQAILDNITDIYSTMWADAETTEDRTKITTEYNQRMKEAYAAIADSYVEFAQVYIDGIDKINEAITKIQDGSISASDIVELQFLFPDVDINVNDAKASVQALISARKEARSQIETFYNEAADQEGADASAIMIQKEKAFAETDAKTADAIIERIRSYADTADSIRNTMKSVRDKSITQQEIVEFNKSFANVKIDLSDISGTMASLRDALNTQIDEVNNAYNEAVASGLYDEKSLKLLEKTKDETIAAIRAGGIDYANDVADALIESVSNIRDMIQNVKDGNVTQQQLIEFNNIFPDFKVDMSSAEVTISYLRGMNQEIIDKINETYDAAIEDAEGENTDAIEAERAEKLREAYAAIADSYVELSQIYIDGIDKVNDAISKLQDGSISASDMVELKLLSPHIDIDINDVSKSVDTLVAVRDEARRAINKLYDDAEEQEGVDRAALEAQRQRALAQADAKTVDSIISRMQAYSERADKIRDVMTKVREKNISQAEVLEYNQMFPEFKIDTSDTEGSLQILDDALEAQVTAVGEIYDSIPKELMDAYADILTKSRDETVEAIRTGGIDYVNTVADALIESVDTIQSMIQNVQSGSVTQQQIIDFNKLFPNITINLSDVEGTIASLRDANRETLNKLNETYRIALEEADPENVAAIREEWAGKLKEFYATVADAYVEFAQIYVDGIDQINSVIDKIRSGSVTASDVIELNNLFPNVKIDVNDATTSIQALKDARKDAHEQIRNMYAEARNNITDEAELATLNAQEQKAIAEVDAKTIDAEVERIRSYSDNASKIRDMMTKVREQSATQQEVIEFNRLFPEFKVDMTDIDGSMANLNDALDRQIEETNNAFEEAAKGVTGVDLEILQNAWAETIENIKTGGIDYANELADAFIDTVDTINDTLQKIKNRDVSQQDIIDFKKIFPDFNFDMSDADGTFASLMSLNQSIIDKINDTYGPLYDSADDANKEIIQAEWDQKLQEAYASIADSYVSLAQIYADGIDEVNSAIAKLRDGSISASDIAGLKLLSPQINIDINDVESSVDMLIAVRDEAYMVIDRLYEKASEQEGANQSALDAQKERMYAETNAKTVDSMIDMIASYADSADRIREMAQKVRDKTATQTEILEFNSLYPNVKIDMNDTEGSLVNLDSLLEDQVAAVENTFNIAIGKLDEKDTEGRALLERARDQTIAAIRTGGIDYANEVADALVESVSTVRDIIQKVQEGSATQQEIIDFNKMFPTINIDVSGSGSVLTTLSDANVQILNSINETYRAALEDAKPEQVEAIRAEWNTRLKDYYAAVADSYVELAQTYIDGIDTVNDAISKVRDGNLTASDMVSLQLIFPNIELDMNDATSSINALLAARDEAYNQIEQIYTEARKRTSDEMHPFLDAKEQQAYKEVDAKTIDAEVERIRVYADGADQIRNMMKSVRDKSATRQEIAEFNRSFPNIEIDLNDVEGSMRNLNDALQLQIDETENAFVTASKGKTGAELEALQKAKDETIAAIRAGGIDYANDIADALIENVDSVRDIIQKVQDGSITQTEIIEFNNLYPDIQIDMSDKDTTIENLRNANEKVLEDLKATYRTALGQAETDADREAIISEYKVKLKAYYASVADSYVELAQIYIDGISQVNDTIAKIKDGSATASDILDLKLTFPNVKIDVTDAKSSIQALVDAREEAYAQITDYYNKARDQSGANHELIDAQEAQARAQIAAGVVDSEISIIRSYTDGVTTIYDMMQKIAEKNVTQQDIIDFNKLIPDVDIDIRDTKGSMANLRAALDALIEEENQLYTDSLLSVQSDFETNIPLLEKAHEEVIKEIKAKGVDYASQYGDALIDSIGTIGDMMSKVQSGSVTQVEIVDFNKLFPEVKIDMRDIDGTLENLKAANEQVLNDMGEAYQTALDSAEDKAAVTTEWHQKFEQAYAAIADSYINLAQVYVDSIDKINSAIANMQEGNISAVDIIELKLIFPDLNIDVRDAGSSVRALLAAREQAETAINQFYDAAVAANPANEDTINAQRDRELAESNAKTADAIIEQIRSYGDRVSTIRDTMEKVRDQSATQQDVIEFNQMFPAFKIDLTDREGSLATMEEAIEAQNQAIVSALDTALTEGGFSTEIQEALKLAKEQTLEAIQAGGVDYANSISAALVENVGTINDMILKVQSGTVTQQEILDFNKVFPDIKIDMSNTDATIENLRAASQQIIDEINELYLEMFNNATSTEERAAIIVARMKALQSAYAAIADSYTDFADKYIDGIDKINDAIANIRSGNISASDIVELRAIFPDIDIDVNDVHGSIQKLLEARQAAYDEIDKAYEDAEKVQGVDIEALEAEKLQKRTEVDARTVDAGIEQLNAYVDEASTIRDMIQKISDGSATQQDIFEFNKLFPDVEIDMSDIDGSIANLNTAYDKMLEAENIAYMMLLASTDDETFRNLYTQAHERNVASIRAAGVDYAKEMSSAILDNAQTLWDMMASLRDGTVTEQQIVEFNELFPTVEIDTSDTKKSIQNCKRAADQVLDDIDAYFENEIARAGGDKKLINSLKVSWASAVKKAYAFMSDNSETYIDDLVANQVSNVSTLSEALTNMASGEFTTQDQYDLINEFPMLASSVNNLDEAVKQLLIDSNSNAITELWEQFDYAQTDEAREKILALIEVLTRLKNETASKLVLNIDAEITGSEMVADALTESASETGLSYDMTQKLIERYKEMKDFNLDEMFVNTAMGVRLNTKAMAKLESAYRKQKRADAEGELKKLQEQYKELTAQINDASTEAERAELISKRDDLSDQINQVTQLAASYTGLNSAYSQWMAAQETPHEGSAYENVASSLEDIEDLYNKGLTGTDDFNSWITMVSGQDADAMGYAEKMATYQKYMPMMKKWFTENYEGAYNFLEAANKVDAQMVHMNEDGTWNIDIDADKLAKEMGVGVDVIEMMLYRLKDLDFDLDIWDTDSEWLHDIEKDTQTAIDKLHELGLSSDIEFDFKTGSIEKADDQIEQFKKALVDLGIASGEGEDFEINLDVEGGEEAASILSELYAYRSYLDRPAILKVDTSSLDADTSDALSKLNRLFQLLSTHEANVKVGKIDPAVISEIRDLAGELSNLDGDTKAKIGIDTEAVDTALHDLENVDATISNATIDETVINNFRTALEGIDPVELKLESQSVEEHLEYIQNFEIETKQFNVSLTDLASATLVAIKNRLDKIKDKTVTVKTNYVSSTAGAHGTFARGTLHATGHAKKIGDIGAKKTETALTGELGPELVVRGDKFFTVGDDGAEFANIQKGDIIFDADQTRELLTKGKLSTGNTRGKSYASGTSYALSARGTNGVGTGPSKPNRPGSSSGSGSSSGGGSSSSSNKKDDNEKIDWIEVLIDRIERAIDRLARIAESAFKKLGVRLNATADEIAKVTEEIGWQQQGYDRYIQEAESVKLSEDIKQLVRDGKIDIKSYKKETAELIKEYQQWCLYKMLHRIVI